MTPEYVEVIRQGLLAKGVTLEPGLTGAEFAEIEADLRFRFPADLRLLLSTFLPSGGKEWPDWRNHRSQEMLERLDPGEYVAEDVEDDFWIAAWGERPEDDEDAADEVRRRIALAPPMIPIYAHRYLPAGEAGNPVFSIWGWDTIIYGSDLGWYFRNEFKLADPPWPEGVPRRIAFWSELVEAE